MSIKCPWCESQYDSSLSKCPKCGQVKIDRSIYEYGMTLSGDAIAEVIRSFDAADPDKNEAEIKHLLDEAEKWSNDQEKFIPGPRKKILHIRDDGDLEEKYIRENGHTNVIKADRDRVMKYLMKAAKLGSLPAVVKLVEVVGYSRIMDQLALLCAAAKWGSWGKKRLIDGMHSMYSMCKFWEKYDNAITILDRFSGQGYAWAKCVLGQMLYDKDRKLAIQLVKESAHSLPRNNCHAEAVLKSWGVVSGKADKGQRRESRNSEVHSPKKRWIFILLGLLGGIVGLHFLYARRKGWFVLYWLLLIANFVHVNVPLVANLVPALSKIPIFGLLAGLIFVSSIFFMKNDGDGNRM